MPNIFESFFNWISGSSGEEPSAEIPAPPPEPIEIEFTPGERPEPDLESDEDFPGLEETNPIVSDDYPIPVYEGDRGEIPGTWETRGEDYVSAQDVAAYLEGSHNKELFRVYHWEDEDQDFYEVFVSYEDVYGGG
jgi:hypothetical protein